MLEEAGSRYQSRQGVQNAIGRRGNDAESQSPAEGGNVKNGGNAVSRLPVGLFLYERRFFPARLPHRLRNLVRAPHPPH